MSDKTELLPCPFCGGKATVELTMQDTRVGCLNPKCSAIIFRRNNKGGRRNETAIAAWNRRSHA